MLQNPQNFRKSLRVLKGFTLYDVAQRLNRSTSYIHCIEAGKVRPSPKEARVIARLLDAPKEALFPEISKD